MSGMSPLNLDGLACLPIGQKWCRATVLKGDAVAMQLVFLPFPQPRNVPIGILLVFLSRILATCFRKSNVNRLKLSYIDAKVGGNR